MTKAYITYNGVKSTDLGLLLTNDISSQSTVYEVEEVTIPGRDGVLLRDRKRLLPVHRSYPFIVRASDDLTKAQDRISDWVNVRGYHPLKLSWDEGHTYIASVTESFDIQEISRAFGRVNISFLLHPIKFIDEGLEFKPLVIRENNVFNNPGNVLGDPIIKIEGSGDCTIAINGRQTKLKGIQGGITIDMQKQQVYNGRLQAWDKVVRDTQYPMPYLDLGKNTIQVEAGADILGVKIAPYWGRKL